MMTRIGRLLLSGLIALCSIAATCIIASPAMAQHACPSPGPNEQVVGMHDGGPGIGQLPLCVYRDQNQPPQQAPRPTAKWASIAWHVDVEQDAMRLEAVDHGKRLGAVVCSANLVAIELEQQRERGSGIFHVVNDDQPNSVIAHCFTLIEAAQCNVMQRYAPAHMRF